MGIRTICYEMESSPETVMEKLFQPGPVRVRSDDREYEKGMFWKHPFTLKNEWEETT